MKIMSWNFRGLADLAKRRLMVIKRLHYYFKKQKQGKPPDAFLKITTGSNKWLGITIEAMGSKGGLRILWKPGRHHCYLQAFNSLWIQRSWTSTWACFQKSSAWACIQKTSTWACLNIYGPTDYHLRKEMWNEVKEAQGCGPFLDWLGRTWTQ